MTTHPAPCDRQYERRRPEQTACYKIVQEHLLTFIAAREAEGRPLPGFVVDELEAFLKCGIPAFGFLRLRCNGCGREMIVAFSCKLRGFCPSCCAKRAAEAAAHLIDNVLPLVPYRQFVVTFPIPMRYWILANAKLYASVHRSVIREIHRDYKTKARALGIKNTTPGSISFTQRWGSACNVHPHMHVLCPDAIFFRSGDKVRSLNVGPIADAEVAALVAAIARSVMRLLRKRGLLDKEGEVVGNPMYDGWFADGEAISLATSCSVEITEEGKVKLRLKSAWGDGTTHLLFSPEEWLEKLVALIPPPKSHLVRWSGVFAPSSPLRREVVLTCIRCGADMDALGAVTDPDSIVRTLKHEGIPHLPPSRGPPQSEPGSLRLVYDITI